MHLYIIRHGDPDYSIDSLTEKGDREARLLADRLSKLDVAAFYCSPLGRARRTASYTLEKMGRTAEILPWLREFEASVPNPESGHSCLWDRLPSFWTAEDAFYSYDRWLDHPLFEHSNAREEYEYVTGELDRLLERHGYRHEGRLFRVLKPNADNVVLFCHFGVEGVILSHLFSVSPMVIWHSFRALTSSVTHLVTEEREEGIAQFTALQFGDLSHLYAAGEEPAFAARFCERFTDETRH